MNTATSDLVPCKRCRIGDYVMGEDSEGENIVGRISKVSGDLITVTTRQGSEHEFLRYQTYRATKEAYMSFNPATNSSEDPIPSVETMYWDGLGATSDFTEDTSLESEDTNPADSPSSPAPATKCTLPPADGSCPLCGAEAAQQTPNGHNTSSPVSNFCNSCGRAWSLKTGREVKVLGPVRLHPDLTHYVKHTVKTVTGRSCLDIDDQVAFALRGLNVDDCYRQTSRYLIAMGVTPTAKRPTTMSGLRAKYGHLNPGMQRMNLGNILRGALRSLGTDLPEVEVGEDLENPDE